MDSPRTGRRGAKDGELVLAEQIGPKARMGLPKASVVERLGNPSAPKAVSLIAIHQHGIPDHFPDELLPKRIVKSQRHWVIGPTFGMYTLSPLILRMRVTMTMHVLLNLILIRKTKTVI